MKYYFMSGDVKLVVEGDSPRDVARKAVMKNDTLDEPKPLGVICQVSETGFHSPDGVLHDSADVYIRIDGLLRECGFKAEADELAKKIDEMVQSCDFDVDNKTGEMKQKD